MHKVFENTNIDISKYPIKTYKKNEIVFEEGEFVNKLGLIINGCISIKTYTFNEKEYEINNISSGGIFGEYIIFSDNPKFLGTGIALKETTIIYLSKKDLFELLKDKTFYENYFKLISQITISIQNKVKVLSQKEIRDKILFLLYENLKRTKSNSLYISSKQRLSEYLNITRPSLSRELINMRDEGIITFDKHYIRIEKSYL